MEPAIADQLAALGYRIESELGAGGFAVVHAAHRPDGAEVAIKVGRRADPDVRARFAREAEALAAIGPPSVPALLASGVLAGGQPYLVMERIAARSLAEIMRDAGRLPLPRIAAIADAVLAALERAHAAGIWHRDLKPSNLLVDERGARLIDFGIAAVAGAPRLTRAGAPVGTLDYMAPEQIRGEPAQAAGDLYAVGVILYQMLTGEHPFPGDRPEVERGHLMLRPPPPGRRRPMPPAVEQVLLDCLAKRPDQRPAGVAAVRRALAAGFTAAVDDTPGAAAGATPAMAGAAGREPIAVVWVSGDVSPFELREALAGHGGILVGQRADGWMCALAATTAADPPGVAHALAEQLVRDGAAAAVVHVGEARVRRARGGSMIVGELVDDPEAWLPRPVPPGVSRSAPPAPGAAGAAPLLGRDELVARMRAGLAEACAGAGPVVLTVAGDRGTGKSRLADVAAELAAAAGARLIRAAGRSSWTGPGDDTLAALQAATCAGRGARNLGAQVHELAAGLQALAADAPIAIVVDEAHLADDAALDALAGAVAGAARRLWVAVFTDPVLLSARPTWGLRAHRHDCATLGALDAATARRLAAALLAPVNHPPAAALARLVDWSGGNPAQLVDLVDALRREGLIRPLPGSDVWQLAVDELDRLPPGAADTWAAERELARLPPELARLAELAAILGPDAEGAELVAVLSALERDGVTGLADAGSGLAALAARGLLGSGNQFRRRSLREAIRARAPADLRTAAHRHALAWWRARPANQPRRLRRIAHHAAAAREAAAAVAALLALAAEAAAVHRHHEVEELCTRALELAGPADPRSRAMALRVRGEARRHLTHYEDALADLRAARALVEPAGDAVELTALLVAEAAVCDFTERHQESAELIELARRAAPAELPAAVDARLHNWLGVARHRQQRWDQAIPLLTAAAALGDRAGDHESAVGARLILAACLRHTGDVDGGLALLDQVIECCSQEQDWFHLAIGLCNRINFWRLRRDLTRAIADLERAMAIAAEMGFDEIEMYGRTELAELDLYLGRLASAVEHAAIAHRIAARRFRDQPVIVPSAAYALLLAHSGRFAEAAAIAAALRPRVGGNPALTASVRGAELAASGADDGTWDAYLAEAEAALSPEEQVAMRWLRGRCAAHREQPARAAAALADALVAARAAASTMSTPIAAELAVLAPASALL